MRAAKIIKNNEGCVFKTIFVKSLLISESLVQFGGQNITAERGISVGDIPTTDEHGWARKRGVITSYACGEKSKLSKLWARDLKPTTQTT